MIVLGMLNLQIIFFHTKFCIFASVMIARASASTYFVKYLIATSKIFTYFLPWARGLLCQSTIVQMAIARSWSSFSPLVSVGSFHTSGIFLSHFLTKSFASFCVIS